MTEPVLSLGRRSLWHQGAADFFFLQNRHYPRSASLEWVGNRYQFNYPERQLLHRGVFSQAEILKRRAKRCRGAEWQKGYLIVDGHNVQITVESALLGRPFLVANDMAVRDLAGQSANFRFTEASEMALDMIFSFLEEFRPRKILFLFDAPLSHSGLLAERYRQRLKKIGLRGDARAVPVPEREFPYQQGVIACSDHAVLNEAVRWIDLARRIIDRNSLCRPIADFSDLIYAKTPLPYLAEPF